MKNILKNSAGLMLLACLSLVVLTGCNQKSRLKLSIEAANKQCPISMGTAGEVTSITFDGSDVCYVLTMNEDYMNLDALKQNPEAMKSAVMAMFGNPNKDVKQMLELVVDVNSGIKFIYKGQTSGKEVEYYLKPEEIKSILNDKTPQEESDQKKLEELVNMTNVSCPMAVDESTTLDKLTIDSENVVYHYTIDEETIDMSALKENAEQMKQAVKGSLDVSEPALKVFLEACVKCNKGLGYHYKGNTSGEEMEFTFSAAEVKSLL